MVLCMKIYITRIITLSVIRLSGLLCNGKQCGQQAGAGPWADLVLARIVRTPLQAHDDTV